VATMGPLVDSGPNLEERVIVSAEINNMQHSVLIHSAVWEWE
jgi:hypothetical protein